MAGLQREEARAEVVNNIIHFPSMVQAVHERGCVRSAHNGAAMREGVRFERWRPALKACKKQWPQPAAGQGGV